MISNNWTELQKAIMDKAQKGVKEELLPKVTKQMKLSMKRVVYDVYKPLEYKRRRFSRGGLGDSKNIIGTIKNKSDSGFQFNIEDIAMASRDDSSEYLAPLIIMGQEKAKSYGYGLLYHDGSENKPYGKPRDFISDTKNNLNQNELTKNLQTYMKG